VVLSCENRLLFSGTDRASGTPELLTSTQKSCVRGSHRCSSGRNSSIKRKHTAIQPSLWSSVYESASGRSDWPSRDPINENGYRVVAGQKGKRVLEEEKDLYCFLDNDSLNDYDINGLSGGAAAGCAGGLAITISAVPAGAVIIGTVIVAGVSYVAYEICTCPRYRCKDCNPKVGTLMYEIAPANSRQRGRHVGIDHVKYWKMNQAPLMIGGMIVPASSCACYWNYDHTDDNTLIPVPGAIPGGPPTVTGGPTLGGGPEKY